MKIRIGTIFFLMLTLGYCIGKMFGIEGVTFMAVALAVGSAVNNFTKERTVDIL